MAEKTLICGSPDAEMVTAGAVFDKRCDRCNRAVVIAPSGQRFLSTNDNVEIICIYCYLADNDAMQQPIALSASPDEVLAELASLQPNLHRTRKLS